MFQSIKVELDVSNVFLAKSNEFLKYFNLVMINSFSYFPLKFQSLAEDNMQYLNVQLIEPVNLVSFVRLLIIAVSVQSGALEVVAIKLVIVYF